MVAGSPGGSRIITTTLQVIINVIDHDMDIADAVSLPRFHHQWQPDSIYYDRYGLSADTIKGLESMKHLDIQAVTTDTYLGDANSILYEDGVIHGIKDPRAEGAAIGL